MAAETNTQTIEAAKPDAGIMLEPRQSDFNRFFAGDPTPVRVRAALLSAAFGQPDAQWELFDKMIEASGHIRCESDKRRMAVTGLAWGITSASTILEGDLEDADAEKADDIAKHVRRVMRHMRGLTAGLKHLIDAVGRGVAVCEVEWALVDGKLVPVALHKVPSFRLRYDYNDPWRLRILMNEFDNIGTPVDELPFGKFIVHAPREIGGSVLRGGLCRPSLFWWMASVFGIKFLLEAVEIFGQPFRTATFSPNATDQIKQSMLAMLKSMARTASGIFPEGTEFQIHESGLTGNSRWPQIMLTEFCNAEISKIWIGATLMTQVGEGGGNRALGEVQNDIREDIRDDDITSESETITEQLVRAIVMHSEFAAKGGMELMPKFKRTVPEPKDDKADAELLDRGINRWGMKVPTRYAVERFKIPVTDDTDMDAPLPGAAAGGDEFSREMSNDTTLANAERVKGQRKLDEILKRRSSAAKLSAWIMAAVLAATGHTANVVAAVSGFIEKRRDLETALAELPDVFAELPTAEMQQLQERFLLATKLAGALESREKIASKGRGKARLAKLNARRRIANAESMLVNADIDFERIPFVQAIESLRDRIGLNPDEFAALEAEARSRAWRVAGVYDMGVLATIHQALVKSIAEGETSRSFRLRLPSMVDAAGWSGENPYHADLVHFQNFMMAHSAGRFSEYQEFGAAGWMFVSNGDACPMCEPFINKVFKLSDRKAFPPVHFWCDCEDEVVFDGEHETFDESANIKSGALDVARSKPSGFKWDPAEYANKTPLKVGGFPPALQPAFKKFGEEQGWEVVE